MEPVNPSSLTPDRPLKRRQWAIALALAGALLPGLHKFYLRQWVWGVAYLALLPTHIPQVASLIEALWYWSLGQDEFDHNFNSPAAQLAGQSSHSANRGQPPLASGASSPKSALNPALQTAAARALTTSEAAAPSPSVRPDEVKAIADALRELEQLRQDGLISEYEFEQKRRQWLDRMS